MDVLKAGAIVAIMATTAAAPDPATRSALLDAARAPVEADLGKPVKFKVDRINVVGADAFLLATMEDTAGRPLDFTGTRLAEAAARGFASHRYAALLHKGDSGWTVAATAVAPGDVAWRDWATRYKVPASLFDD